MHFSGTGTLACAGFAIVARLAACACDSQSRTAKSGCATRLFPQVEQPRRKANRISANSATGLLETDLPRRHKKCVDFRRAHSSIL
jgi:hypothetical protein